VVPIVLIAALTLAGVFSVTAQLAVYLVTSELDRRIDSLQAASDAVVRAAPASRPGVMEGMVNLFYRDRYPGIEILLRDSGHLIRYPENGTLPAPLDGWQPTSGVLVRDHRLYLWSYARTPTGDVTVSAPLTRELLAGLAPNLGVIDRFSAAAAAERQPPARVPPPVNGLDREVRWFATVPAADWNHPGQPSEPLVIGVRTRVSAVLTAVFNRGADVAQNFLQITLIIGAVLFLIVELISLVIGISMVRTITGAVHRLYEGTQKMIEGDFSHRIEVAGRDQLADLGSSFNRMTAHLEQSLAVAKEKERLQSEIEIARQVQNHLYPREAPRTRTLRLKAVCQPARVVSGDYYDYAAIRDAQVALAIGDVAGKGISAALLTATLQSSLRAQLQSETAPSPSLLAAQLNQQLYAYTSAEKYATFCLGIYDETSGELSYTNAGHVPPVLIREGVPQRLEVNGTVVGAFPFSAFEESRVETKSGDLLVCFTDGVTEPENEYGEMFNEDRFIDLVARNSHRSEEQIIELVIDSVRQWTGSGELQDDMTILLARRI
jgi:sigma-B regulation protein RsbU (phosphoserine phosphatase)